MKNYAMYLRKSRKDISLEELGEGETLAKHEHILMELAEKGQYNVTKIYKEMVTADTIEDRPEMMELLKDVKQGLYEGVLVVEVERLARGATKDQGIVSEVFQLSKTKIITPMKVYDTFNDQFDEEYLEFGLYMSRREYNTIKRRLEQGKRESVKQGNFILSIAPYGYDICRINKKERTLSINEEEATVVRAVYKAYLEGMSTCQIANSLTMKGVKTRSGAREWSKATIRNILKNKIYIGKITYYNRKNIKTYDEDGNIVKKCVKNDDILEVQGKHQPLVTEEDYNKVQEIFKTKAPVNSSCELTNCLAGLLYCSKCGKIIYLQKYPKHPNRQARFIHDESLFCKQKSCTYDDVIDLLIEGLQGMMNDFEIEIKEGSTAYIQGQYKKKLNNALAKMKALEGKKTRLFDFYEDGSYTREEFLNRKEKLDDEMKKWKNIAETLKSNPPKESNYKAQIYTYKKAIETLRNDRIKPKTKNDFLKSFIDRIEYTSEDLGRHKGTKVHLDIHLK